MENSQNDERKKKDKVCWPRKALYGLK
jgi:hypothetical protein